MKNLILLFSSLICSLSIAQNATLENLVADMNGSKKPMNMLVITEVNVPYT